MQNMLDAAKHTHPHPFRHANTIWRGTSINCIQKTMHAVVLQVTYHSLFYRLSHFTMIGRAFDEIPQILFP